MLFAYRAGNADAQNPFARAALGARAVTPTS